MLCDSLVTQSRIVFGPVPPIQPVWFGSAMGSGILTTLIGRHIDNQTWLRGPDEFLLAASSVLLVVLVVGYLVRCLRDARAFTATMSSTAVEPAWGSVSMGFMAVGASWLTSGPQLGWPKVLCLHVDLWCWLIGTAIGWAATLAFTRHLMLGRAGRPLPAWGLAVVGPMVSATVGAGLVDAMPSQGWKFLLITVCAACFMTALVLGGLIFALAYHEHFMNQRIGMAALSSTWIPLGVVGQSIAAAGSIAVAAAPMLTADGSRYALTISNTYGYAMLVAAVPVVGFAIRWTVFGVIHHMPFNPGWWAMTFPLGTLSLGSQILGANSGHHWIELLGIGVSIALAGTWLLCSVSSLYAIAHNKAARARELQEARIAAA